jgi:sarcosine oxidase
VVEEVALRPSRNHPTTVDYVVVGLGALGSGAAWELATRGYSVVGLEQFELGHSRGASHDTSRILRHSYHTPAYVRLTCEAYDDWARLEVQSGESLVTVVGGLDLFPPDCVIRPDDYVTSLREVGIAFEELDVDEIRRRWPQFHPPAGTLGLFQERGAIVPAARGTAAMQRLASQAGAPLLGSPPVTRVTDLDSHLLVETGDATYTCRGVVVAADAWTNQVLAGLGVEIPLTVTLEQPTYFAPADP